MPFMFALVAVLMLALPAARAGAQGESPRAATKRDSLIWRRDYLHESFHFAANRVEGGGTFHHYAAAGDRARNRLSAIVLSDGRAYLRSHYLGAEWLFHERVSVRIGSRVLRSSVIPITSRANVRTVVGGGVEEELRFSGATDGGILAAIVAAPDSVSVIIKLEGHSAFEDYELSATNRRELKESVELARLIRTVGLDAKATTKGPQWVGYRPLMQRYLVAGVCQIPSGPSEGDWYPFQSVYEAETSKFVEADETACAHAMNRPKVP